MSILGICIMPYSLSNLGPALVRILGYYYRINLMNLNADLTWWPCSFSMCWVVSVNWCGSSMMHHICHALIVANPLLKIKGLMAAEHEKEVRIWEPHMVSCSSSLLLLLSWLAVSSFIILVICYLPFYLCCHSTYS